MIELTNLEMYKIFVDKITPEQDCECRNIAKEAEGLLYIKVKFVYKFGRICIIVNTDEIFGYQKANDLGKKISAKLKYENIIDIYSYMEVSQAVLVGCFSEMNFGIFHKYNFLPQAEKIYKTKGYEKNWKYIFNRQYELNIFYKNSWKLKKAIKDGSAEALRESILEVVAKYDKEKMFNKDNFPINFCNMRKYNMFTESRG